MVEGRSDRPRVVTLHQSFVQPMLVLGAEREPFIIVALVSASLVLSLGNVYLAAIGTLMWTFTLPVLRRLATADSQMTRVYLRHVRYAGYCPASARANAPTRLRTDWH